MDCAFERTSFKRISADSCVFLHYTYIYKYLLTGIYLSFQFSASISENSLSSELLRIQALDADEEFTDNWLAEFFFISGNEDNCFEIVTDRATNQGILRVIKVWKNILIQLLK